MGVPPARTKPRARGSQRPTTTPLGAPPARRAWGRACQTSRLRHDPPDRPWRVVAPVGLRRARAAGLQACRLAGLQACGLAGLRACRLAGADQGRVGRRQPSRADRLRTHPSVPPARAPTALTRPHRRRPPVGRPGETARPRAGGSANRSARSSPRRSTPGDSYGQVWPSARRRPRLPGQQTLAERRTREAREPEAPFGTAGPPSRTSAPKTPTREGDAVCAAAVRRGPVQSAR